MSLFCNFCKLLELDFPLPAPFLVGILEFHDTRLFRELAPPLPPEVCRFGDAGDEIYVSLFFEVSVPFV